MSFNKDTDHLIFVGDIVAKGPDSLGVIDLARSLGASCVRGNHEERVARIRAQRKAQQEAERAANPPSPRSKTSQTPHDRQTSAGDHESDSDPDGENGRRLTQHSRPTRKAGKKAMEEMQREQQRISRNMQLTHQAKTKKKYAY